MLNVVLRVAANLGGHNASADWLRAIETRLRGRRLWSLVSSLSLRLSGFITAFMLARFAGAALLGQYSAIANTASAVSAPFTAILLSSATVAISTALKGSSHAVVWSTAKAYVVVAAAIAGLCGLTAAWLFFVFGATDLDRFVLTMALITTVCSVFRQFGVAVWLGVLYAAEQFQSVGTILLSVTGLAVICVIPAVYWFGLSGAFSVSIGVSFLYLLGLARKGYLCFGRSAGGETYTRIRAVVSQLRRDAPAIGGRTIIEASGWLTIVYFVGRSWSSAGIGLVGVGVQWLNLMALTVSSWSGVTVKLIAEAVANEGATEELRRTVRRLLAKNAAVTAVGAVAMFAGANLLADVYGLGDTAFPLILRLNAISALFLSVNNVFERLLYCLGRQTRLFRISLIGYSLQLTSAALLIPANVAYAAVAVAIGNAAFALLNAYECRHVMGWVRS